MESRNFIEYNGNRFELIPAADIDRVRELVGKLIHNCDCTQLRIGDRPCDCEVPELRTLLGVNDD